MYRKLLSFFRPLRGFVLGLLFGTIATGAFNSWRNQNGARAQALWRDVETWSEYIELLPMADEISKDRADIDLAVVRDSLKRRLRVAKSRAEASERRPAVVIPLWGEIESPIWDHHIPLLQRAIICLENGERFDQGLESKKLYEPPGNSPAPSADPRSSSE